MMFSRKIINEIGFLDEDFFMFAEDIDFCYRIKNKGYDVVYENITNKLTDTPETISTSV